MPWWDCGHCKESNEDNIVCLDYNHLSLTEVPSEIFTFERTLEDLYLESNRITDLPRQLFHCHGLKTLNLSDNEISVIPAAISALENLQWLDLSKNSITTLPDTIKDCSNLTYLNVSLNPIEKLCDPLTCMLSLVELHLNDIYLEYLPANFGRLVNLKILELRENNLITLPKSMSRLINLTRLDIGQNEFTELPEVVSNLLNLMELWIDSNRIRRLPANIGQLRKLVHFDASNNCIQQLPRNIGYWTKVVEFCVTNNEIIEIPSTIGNMKNLIGLKLDENRIQVLPDSIGKLSNLEELMLAHNDLVALPETVGLLRKLQVLSVDKNMLTSIPIEIGSCISLRILSLRSNRLNYIPAELGHLSNLRVLNLINNNLRELPVSLLKLNKLAALWLSDNQSQPLIPLQQDFNPETSQMCLTCFMLPQINTDTIQENNNQNTNENVDLIMATSRRHICFAPDAGALDQPQRLSRAPTPYPKELRALARHARSVQRGLCLVPSSSSQSNDKKEMQAPSDIIEIKEAKVTYKTEVSQHSQNYSTLNITNPDQPQYQSTPIVNSNIDFAQNCTELDNRSVSPQMVVGKPKMEKSIIREATFVRVSDPEQKLTTSVNKYCDNQVPSQNTPPNLPSQPPPYYIAAAQSLHAEYFSNLNKRLSQRPVSPPSNHKHYSPANTNAGIYNELQKYKQLHTATGNHLHTNDLKLDNLSIKSNETSVHLKPPTFIQDKPLVGQHIVAPTPQRLHPPPVTTNSHILKPSNLQIHTATHHDMTDWNNSYSQQSSPNKQIKWLFGKHKNASVIQISIQKNNNDLGFRIVEEFNNGIFVSEVAYNGPAHGLLKPGDKILDVDSFDFTKINLDNANQILQNAGPVINLMISRS